MEETSLDLSPFLNQNDFIELSLNEHKVRLYIVHGIDESLHFEAQTRKEISVLYLFTFEN